MDILICGLDSYGLLSTAADGYPIVLRTISSGIGGIAQRKTERKALWTGSKVTDEQGERLRWLDGCLERWRAWDDGSDQHRSIGHFLLSWHAGEQFDQCQVANQN